MNSTTIIILLLVVVVIMIIIYLFVNTGTSTKGVSADIKNKLKTMPSSQTDNPHELKSILVEYDKLMDYYLKQLKLPGETMGERLMNARSKFDKETYNKIWTAHKLRNSLVHEFGMQVKPEMIRNEIYNLRKALQSIK